MLQCGPVRARSPPAGGFSEIEIPERLPGGIPPGLAARGFKTDPIGPADSSGLGPSPGGPVAGSVNPGCASSSRMGIDHGPAGREAGDTVQLDPARDDG